VRSTRRRLRDGLGWFREVAAVAKTEEVLAAIDQIAETELQLDRKVDPADELLRDLQLDSLTLTVLAVGLEDRFKVILSEEDAMQVVTVRDLAELVARKTEVEVERRAG
jgi:acyl carrier protein